MTLSDKMAYRQIVGCLMHNPLLFIEYQDIEPTDFDNKIARICFIIIRNLYNEGATKLTPIEVDQEIEKHPNSANIYQKDNGLDFLKISYEFAEVNNFGLYYNRLKKYSLLRRLVKEGYDVSDYYIDDKEVVNPLEEVEKQENFDNASIEDILNSVESKYNVIRNEFLKGGRSKGDPADGIMELIDELQKTPNIGPSLEGRIFSSACRGARQGCFYLKSSASSVGKALPNSVIIPTPNGYKKVNEIKVGDYLFDAFGKPTKVLGVYPQGIKQVWEVIFKDGRIARCCDEHLWSYCTRGQKENAKKNRKFFTDSLKNIKNKELQGKRQNNNILVPMNYAVEYSEKELYPSPYAMGALLGDGSFRYQKNQKALYFSSEDEELVQYVANELGYNYEKNCNNNYSWTFKLKNPIPIHNGPARKNVWVEEILKNYPDLWQAKSEDKFIPKDYLQASIEQRFQLLNGLLDTDGSIGEKGSITYWTISTKLRDNVIELCRGLGLKATIFEDKHKSTNICYCIKITGRPSDKSKLFCLSRKKEKLNNWFNNGKRKESNEFNPIVEIRDAGYEEEMTCFYVDNPEHLFLTENYIVTHNTRTAVFDACHLCYPMRWSHDKRDFIVELGSNDKIREARKVLFIVTEMDREELQSIMLAYLSGVNEAHILTGKYDFGELQRVRCAANIIKKYSGYFFVEEISEPNLVNVEATIKKYATVENVKFVFFDYIHSTGSLLNQFSKASVRPDMLLMMLANQLKQLAKDYQIFIASATQVNATGMADDGEFKNETAIRDAKSINDKADVSFVISKIGDKTLNSCMTEWRKAAREGYLDPKFIEDPHFKPTHVIDIYKMRRGRYKNVRIWTHLDLGNGERRDLFMTTADNQPLEEPFDLFTSSYEETFDWRNYFDDNTNIIE